MKMLNEENKTATAHTEISAITKKTLPRQTNSSFSFII